MNDTRELVNLGRRGIYKLDDAAGVQFTCTRGSVWLTVDDDQRDIVLEAGESYAETRHRGAVLYAFEISAVTLRRRAVVEHTLGQRLRTTAQVSV